MDCHTERLRGGGDFTSRGLAPGKYFVLAVKSQIEGRDFSPELVARLQAARNRAREVTVDSGATPRADAATGGPAVALRLHHAAVKPAIQTIGPAIGDRLQRILRREGFIDVETKPRLATAV